ncbi:DNA-binding SARP family transcriptional activator [Kibdelosporangium banguiense]|uniref:DNA-binding SARP family transcriptional activator n=1 Tax=Kibdelosporangium banguiense TaxID=1365924 RepID=A0ABS4U332_9PSEU|nr:BTAD domain-containing putative transcriptional regulator [Kibdelosporangium banguiense]MBP2330581.1 DNA-binding SARP family transcriptional activator [Kibdelosporangium banguiense]
MTMRVRFFGDFSVHIGDEPVDQPRGKIAGLFQYLLLNRGHTVGREKLYEVLWPGREPSTTDSSLKVAVHTLRQVLKRAGPGAEIAGHTNGYVLRADDLWLDVDEFDVCLDAGRIAEDAGDFARAARCYRQAVELYRGDLLASETADWVTAQRECDRALVLYALSWLRADALRRGDHPAVITLCRRIIEIDPYHEETYQTLMLAHGRRGELGQVRNWHKLCVRRLQDDLDVAPTATTSRIYSRAVRGELRVPVAA